MGSESKRSGDTEFLSHFGGAKLSNLHNRLLIVENFPPRNMEIKYYFRTLEINIFYQP